MNEQGDWPRIAVVGAGAVGGFYGGLLARAGAPVVMIGRPKFADVVSRKGLLLESIKFQERIKVEASSQMSAASNADIVLLSVKTYDTDAVTKELAKVSFKKAIVVSMQNGVDNVAQIQKNWNVKAIAAAVYVAVAMNEPGKIKHTARGDLIIGPNNPDTNFVASVFERGGIPCKVSDELQNELWTKLLWNCAANAISALAKVDYGRLTSDADGRMLICNVVDEVMSLARAQGIEPVGMDVTNPGGAIAKVLGEQMPEATSSMARDLERGQRTEIDALNGFVVRLGQELNIATPVNHALYTLVKLAESVLHQ